LYCTRAGIIEAGSPTYNLDHTWIRLNPLPPSDAVRKERRFILEDLFRAVLSQFKKYHPSQNLKFNYLGIFQSLKLRIILGKIPPISLKLNFNPNTLGCYGLNLLSVLT